LCEEVYQGLLHYLLEMFRRQAKEKVLYILPKLKALGNTSVSISPAFRMGLTGRRDGYLGNGGYLQIPADELAERILQSGMAQRISQGNLAELDAMVTMAEKARRMAGRDTARSAPLPARWGNGLSRNFGKR